MKTIASAAIISWSTLEHSEWPWLTKQEIFQTLACLPGLLLMTVYSSALVVGFSPLSTTPPRKQANLMASTSCQQTTSTHLQVPYPPPVLGQDHTFYWSPSTNPTVSILIIKAVPYSTVNMTIAGLIYAFLSYHPAKCD